MTSDLNFIIRYSDGSIASFSKPTLLELVNQTWRNRGIEAQFRVYRGSEMVYDSLFNQPPAYLGFWRNRLRRVFGAMGRGPIGVSGLAIGMGLGRSQDVPNQIRKACVNARPEIMQISKGVNKGKFVYAGARRGAEENRTHKEARTMFEFAKKRGKTHNCGCCA